MSVTHFRDLFPPLEAAKYLVWKGSHSGREFRGTMRDGTLVQLRPKPFSDYDVAYEIYVFQQYALDLEAKTVKQIVDLGANVGFSCLYWAKKYPSAKILAFEPNPSSAERCRQHLELNSLTDRVTVVEAAAGVSEGVASFLAAGTTSRLSDEDSDKTIQVRVVDFFETLPSGPIDILKIDIEGGEFSILEDSRLSAVPIRNLVMEWHSDSAHPEAGLWCATRLRQCGFRVDGENGEPNGILRAHRVT